MNQKDILTHYIQTYTSKGYSRDQLKSFLVKNRFDPRMVDAATHDALLHRWVRWLVVLLIGAAILVGILLVALPREAISCADDTCFTDAANACAPATLRLSTTSNAIYAFESKSCTVTKRIESFGNEPRAVQDLFASKDMTCAYEKNAFDPALLTLAGGLESCNGPLKEAIVELRVAQAALYTQ